MIQNTSARTARATTVWKNRKKNSKNLNSGLNDKQNKSRVLAKFCIDLLRENMNSLSCHRLYYLGKNKDLILSKTCVTSQMYTFKYFFGKKRFGKTFSPVVLP